MPNTALQIERESDEYAWLLDQAQAVERRRGIDYAGLSEFLTEAADEMLSRVTSQIVNLLAHAAKAAHTKNPQVVGHWRSECVEFHDQIVDGYRPSMRQKINMQTLWQRAKRKVYASFEDHGEPRPKLAEDCMINLEALIDPELKFEMMMAWMINREITDENEEEVFRRMVPDPHFKPK